MDGEKLVEELIDYDAVDISVDETDSVEEQTKQEEVRAIFASSVPSYVENFGESVVEDSDWSMTRESDDEVVFTRTISV